MWDLALAVNAPRMSTSTATIGHRASWPRQRRLIGRFLSDDPALVAAYDDLLFSLVSEPPGP